ncbi:hypothetical protein D3C72_2036450 [compost metagenome]
MLQAFVGGRGGLIQEYDGGPVVQHARERHALLFADGQDAGPILHFVQPSGQMAQVDLPQRVDQARVVFRLRQARVRDHATQVSQWQIGPLRQEQR